MIGPYLRDFLPNEALKRDFLFYEGKRIDMPEKFLPEADFLVNHREEVFQK